MSERKLQVVVAAAVLAFAVPALSAQATEAPPAPALTPAQELQKAHEAARDRAMAFERTLWEEPPAGKGGRYSQKSAVDQRPLVEAFFKTLETPVDKLEFLHVGDSRYAYAINRELYGEYAVKLLEDPDATVRREAVQGLAYNQLRTHGEPLEKLLEDPDAEVRASAISTLARFGRHDLLPRLTEMAKSATEDGVRITALAAIGTLARDKDATPEEREKELATLAPYLAPDAAPAMQQTVLYAIGPIAGSPQAARLADAVIKLTTAADAKVREAAIAALTAVEGDPATAAIRAALADAVPEVKRAAARAAGERRDAGASAALVKMLGDEQPWVRIAAIEALAAIGDSGPAARIAALLGDSNVSVRRSAIEALEALSATGFAKEVAGALTDKDETVRLYAVRTLGKIGTKEQAAAVAALAADPYYPTRMWVIRALNAFDARDQRQAIERLTRDPESAVSYEAKMLLEKWDKK